MQQTFLELVLNINKNDFTICIDDVGCTEVAKNFRNRVKLFKAHNNRLLMRLSTAKEGDLVHYLWKDF